MAINVFPIPSSAAVTPTGWTAGVAGTFDLSSTLAAGTYLIKTDTTQTMTITLKSAAGHNFSGTIRGGSGFISLPIAATQITIPGSLTYPFGIEITPISVIQLAAPTSGALSLGANGVMTGTWGTVPTGAVSAHLLTTTGAILDFSSTTSGATTTVTASNTTPNAVNNFVIAFKNSSGAYGTGATVAYTMPATPYPFNVEYLVVGAGGSSGGTFASGGGGGAVKTASVASNTIGSTLTISVAPTTVVNTNGSSSTLTYASTTITATGGGRGRTDSGDGFSGSSGGGGYSQGSTITYNGGTGLDGGNGGNTPTPNTTYSSSGGGGGAGGNASGWNSGNGVASSITGTSTYYAGGGAGGQYSSSGSVGAGGTGRGSAGAANSGAGAGAGSSQGGTPCTGGSGVVIYAYPDSAPALTTIPGTLTYTVDTSTRAGYRVYKFTAGSGTVTI
jgi:hypothetical protein